MGDFKTGGFRISQSDLDRMVDNSPVLDAWMEAKAQWIIKKAQAIFEAEEKKERPARLSHTSPPRYVRSFHSAKVGGKWQVWNDDPNGLWVEIGAHAGDDHTTPILKYRPLGRALDASRDVI